MLAGQQTSTQSMFPLISPLGGPSAEEMESERQRIMFRKHVQVRRHVVKIMNMHNAKDRAAYERLMKQLILGTQAKTHKVWCNDRELVTVDNKQCWLRYIEWTEYELEEEATAPVGVGDGVGVGVGGAVPSN